MFSKKILKAAKSKETHENLISDGKYHCTYHDLPGIFAKIDDFAGRSGISPRDCVILRCANNLPDALLLLWLVYKKRDFLLLPRMRSKVHKEIEDSNLPGFCKYKLTADLDSPGLDIKNPASYLRTGVNPAYKEQIDNAGTGFVFLGTSGSTAEPKLVKHTINKLFKNAMNCVERFELGFTDRLLIPVPIYHMYGLGAALLPGIIADCAINLLGNTNIIKYLEHEKQFKPNISFLTPTLCEMLLKTRKSSYPYQLVVTAGDRIKKTTFENFEKKFGQVINLYGSTELGAIATSRLDDPLDIRCEGYVETLRGVKAELTAAAGKNKTGIGEILCRHDFGFETYVDKKGKPIKKNNNDWFKTGDLGIKIKKNRFKVTGRTGNSINRSGILVAFSEVESLVEQGIGGIAHAVAAAGYQENVRGKKMVLYCELEPAAEISREEIRSLCFQIMPRHMVPDEVVVMKELPRLPNGKFDRKKLAGLIPN